MTFGSKEQLGPRTHHINALKTTRPMLTFYPLELRRNVGHCRII